MSGGVLSALRAECARRVRRPGHRQAELVPHRSGVIAAHWRRESFYYLVLRKGILIQRGVSQASSRSIRDLFVRPGSLRHGRRIRSRCRDTAQLGRRDRRRCPRASGSRCRSRHTSRSLVTAPSHRSCDLLLKATRGVTIALVSSRERKRRQPRLATDDPAFVGWHQLVRGIQGS